jgi:hypothetical protein
MAGHPGDAMRVASMAVAWPMSAAWLMATMGVA